MITSNRIYDLLKHDIITCELKPGASVSEMELCSRYSAGRTPVREASRRLQEDAFIKIIPFRGYFIAPLTFDEYKSLHEAQFVIEPACAALAAERATDAQIRQIELLAEYEYYPGMKTSYCTFLERNFNLHIEIAACSGNQLFEDMVSNLQARLRRYFYQVISMDSYGRELVEEHRAIARAIKRRQPDVARQKSAEHIEKTVQRTTKLQLSALSMEPYSKASSPRHVGGGSTPVATRRRTARARASV